MSKFAQWPDYSVREGIIMLTDRRYMLKRQGVVDPSELLRLIDGAFIENSLRRYVSQADRDQIYALGSA